MDLHINDSETQAMNLLNSRKVNHIWKKDFQHNMEPHEKWDLINSEGICIEVKSTTFIEKFNMNSISPNYPGQKQQIILKLLMDTEKIKSFKFVKFINGEWENITGEVLARPNAKPNEEQGLCSKSGRLVWVTFTPI